MIVCSPGLILSHAKRRVIPVTRWISPLLPCGSTGFKRPRASKHVPCFLCVFSWDVPEAVGRDWRVFYFLLILIRHLARTHATVAESFSEFLVKLLWYRRSVWKRKKHCENRKCKVKQHRMPYVVIWADNTQCCSAIGEKWACRMHTCTRTCTHTHPDLGSGVAVYGAEVHIAVFTHWGSAI